MFDDTFMIVFINWYVFLLVVHLFDENFKMDKNIPSVLQYISSSWDKTVRIWNAYKRSKYTIRSSCSPMMKTDCQQCSHNLS